MINKIKGVTFRTWVRLRLMYIAFKVAKTHYKICSNAIIVPRGTDITLKDLK